jgi:hypothetical protein
MGYAREEVFIAGLPPKEPLYCLSGEINESRLCGGPVWEKREDGRAVQCAELTRIVENVTCGTCLMAIDRFLEYGYKPRIAWGKTSSTGRFRASVYWKKKNAPEGATSCRFMRASSVRQWLRVRGLTLEAFLRGAEPKAIKLHPALEARKKTKKTKTEASTP